MRSWILRLAAAAVVLSLAALAFAYFAVKASLPPLDGQRIVAGLAGPASIERDAAGVVTVTAGNRGDLAFATGYAHGQDRFFQMDLTRRQAAGELSALIGEATIEVDRRYRFHRFRDRAREVLAAASVSDRAILDSYAAGVAEGLASLGAKPFEYRLLGVEPEPWRAEDSVLVVYAMFARLNDPRARDDLRRGYVREALPAAVYDWMYPEGTPLDAPLSGAPRPGAELPPPALLSLRDVFDAPPPAREIGKPELGGSNNWAVAGHLTETGRAMVSNDMHLGHAVPNIWYLARLVQTGDSPRDVTGVTLPGVPFVVAGSNGRVAWAFTNSYGDWSDAVVLGAGAEPGSYRTAEGDRPFVVVRETIGVRDAEPVTYEIRETVFGPVDDLAAYPAGEIAVSWIAHRARAVNLRHLDLETAGSVTDALDAANRIGIPPQNFVAGDADGNIGWTIAGQIPVRPAVDTTLPVSWRDAPVAPAWRDPGDYPRILNPGDGRIWTANARVVDGIALETIGDGGYDLGARAGQIREGLYGKDRFRPIDMLGIQIDDRALFLERWRGLLLETLSDVAIDGHPGRAEYRRLVENWIPRADPASVGYRLVRAFRLEVQSRLFHALTAPVRERFGGDVDLLISNQFESPLWATLESRPGHLLPGAWDSWDAFLLAAVDASIAWYESRYGGELEDRTWGELNTASIRHPLSPAVPWLAGMLDMPAEPLAGDVDMPRAQGPAFGASERFTVSPGDEANGIMHMPAGQSGHPLSPFYDRGHEDWVVGRPAPFLPGAATNRIDLLPAG